MANIADTAMVMPTTLAVLMVFSPKADDVGLAAPFYVGIPMSNKDRTGSNVIFLGLGDVAKAHPNFAFTLAVGLWVHGD